MRILEPLFLDYSQTTIALPNQTKPETSSLTPEQIEKFNKLGFIWDVQEHSQSFKTSVAWRIV